MESRLDQDRKCTDALSHLTSMMDGEEMTEAAFIRLIAKFPDCADVLTSQYELWNELTMIEVPGPTTAMDARFYKYLNEAQLEMEQSPWWKELPGRFNAWLSGLNPAVKWSMVMGVFLVGLLLGRFGFSGQSTPSQFPEFTGVVPEDHMVLASFQHNPSAIDRLKEVQMVKDNPTPDAKIFEALNQVLLHDPNVNVRLSAIESMLYFANEPKVREFLIQAIPFQDSPWVQVALADAMILLQEKQSAHQWQLLLESGQVETDVRMQLEETLRPIL